MVSTLGSFGIVGVGLIGSEFGVTFCETYFVKSDGSYFYFIIDRCVGLLTTTTQAAFLIYSSSIPTLATLSTL